MLGGAVAAVRPETSLSFVRGPCTNGEAAVTEEGFHDRQMATSKYIHISMKEKRLMRVLLANQCRLAIDRPTRGYAGPWLGM